MIELLEGPWRERPRGIFSCWERQVAQSAAIRWRVDARGVRGRRIVFAISLFPEQLNRVADLQTPRSPAGHGPLISSSPKLDANRDNPAGWPLDAPKAAWSTRIPDATR